MSERGTASQRGYDADWQAVQAAYIKAHPYCARCATKGRKRKAQLVDHRIALRDGGARLAWSNLESQCRHCHGIKTHAEGRARKKDDFFQATPPKTAWQSSSIAPTFPGELAGDFFA